MPVLPRGQFNGYMRPLSAAIISGIAPAIISGIHNIQQTRLEALDARTKNSVHKLRLDHLNNQSKAVENIQAARLEALDARTKAVDNIQEARLEVLDARTKSVVR